ncbi:VRR-NUC domain-containing protein [candidate division KSB1 bacterium]|nr:VRR-NUC domain-containing protein [candidate division KSB1 bacterium]
MLTLEKEIERHFCSAIETQRGIVVKFTDPTKRGAPDRVVFIFGVCFFVEFKSPRGKLAKHQIDYAEKLNEQGFKTFLIDSFDKCDRFLYSLTKEPLDPDLYLLNSI